MGSHRNALVAAVRQELAEARGAARAVLAAAESARGEAQSRRRLVRDAYATCLNQLAEARDSARRDIERRYQHESARLATNVRRVAALNATGAAGTPWRLWQPTEPDRGGRPGLLRVGTLAVDDAVALPALVPLLDAAHLALHRPAGRRGRGDHRAAAARAGQQPAGRHPAHRVRPRAPRRDAGAVRPARHLVRGSGRARADAGRAGRAHLPGERDRAGRRVRVAGRPDRGGRRRPAPRAVAGRGAARRPGHRRGADQQPAGAAGPDRAYRGGLRRASAGPWPGPGRAPERAAAGRPGLGGCRLRRHRRPGDPARPGAAGRAGRGVLPGLRRADAGRTTAGPAQRPRTGQAVVGVVRARADRADRGQHRRHAHRGAARRRPAARADRRPVRLRQDQPDLRLAGRARHPLRPRRSWRSTCSTSRRACRSPGSCRARATPAGCRRCGSPGST